MEENLTDSTCSQLNDSDLAKAFVENIRQIGCLVDYPEAPERADRIRKMKSALEQESALLECRAYGSTAIIAAGYDIEITEYLLELGASIEGALVSVISGYPRQSQRIIKAVHFLLEKGADPNEAIWVAVRHKDLLQLLLAAGVNAQICKENGWNLLHQTANLWRGKRREHPDPAVVSMLLETGADPCQNCKEYSNDEPIGTPIQVAMRAGFEEASYLMLDHKKHSGKNFDDVNLTLSIFTGGL